MGEPQPVPDQVKGQCIVCEEANKFLYKGTRYKCHQGSEEHRKAHNRMCYHCASGIDDLDCPIHLEQVYIDFSKYAIVPTLDGECDEEGYVLTGSSNHNKNAAFTGTTPTHKELPPVSQSSQKSSNKKDFPPTSQMSSGVASNEMKPLPPLPLRQGTEMEPPPPPLRYSSLKESPPPPPLRDSSLRNSPPPPLRQDMRTDPYPPPLIQGMTMNPYPPPLQQSTGDYPNQQMMHSTGPYQQMYPFNQGGSPNQQMMYGGGSNQHTYPFDLTKGDASKGNVIQSGGISQDGTSAKQPEKKKKGIAKLLEKLSPKQFKPFK